MHPLTDTTAVAQEVAYQHFYSLRCREALLISDTCNGQRQRLIHQVLPNIGPGLSLPYLGLLL